MKNIIDLTGMKILVAGGSSGIGRQTAIMLSQVGAKIFLVARRKEKLEETMEMLEGSGHKPYAFDLADTGGISELLKKIVENNGKMQGLVYSAGMLDLRPYSVASYDSVIKTMTVNFFSFFEMVRIFAKKSVSDRNSKIVAISSAASYRPSKGQAAYAASKAAMEASIRVLAKEFMPRNIKINYIRPGWTETPLTAQLDKENEQHELSGQPLGAIQPEEISTMVAYLMSSVADKITGRAFDIDGGAFLS